MKLQLMWQTGGEPRTEMDDATRQKVEAYIDQRVGDFRCTDHDKAPTVICRGSRLDALSFDVKACCQKAVYEVKKRLES